MIAEAKQLEGLGKLLKAAGVKPAGTEQMVRDHLHDIQHDATQQHAEILNAMRAVSEDLVVLQQNHSSSFAEIRMAAELMRREVEVSSIVFLGTLRWAKSGLILLILMQLGIFAVLFSTVGRDLIRWPTVAAAPSKQTPMAPLAIPQRAPPK